MSANNFNSDDEAQSSNLDLENQEARSPKELFTELFKSPEEYTTENAKELLRHKKRILTILKTHRPLKLGEYHFGLSANLQKNHRLIVFEWKNKRLVREYTQLNNRPGLWRCRECDNKYEKKLRHKSSFLYIMSGIVFLSSDHECKPRDYKLVMQYQKFLEEGTVHLAQRMSRMVFSYSRKKSSGNTVNAVAVPSSSLKKDTNLVAKPSASLKRKVHDNGFNSTSLESDDKKSKTLNNANASAFSSYQKPASPVEKNETLPVPSKTYSFEIPSTFTLKEICDKLGIKYRKEAIEFWKEIQIDRIDLSFFLLSAKKIEFTQKFKTKNLYKILSNVFTGRFLDYEEIYYEINSALRDKLVSESKIPVEEINSLISSYTVTERHLKFFAEFIPCRIMLINRDSRGINLYGNWKNFNQSNILTLILSFFDRKYSVVTSL